MKFMTTTLLSLDPETTEKASIWRVVTWPRWAYRDRWRRNSESVKVLEYGVRLMFQPIEAVVNFPIVFCWRFSNNVCHLSFNLPLTLLIVPLKRIRHIVGILTSVNSRMRDPTQGGMILRIQDGILTFTSLYNFLPKAWTRYLRI